MACFHSLIDIHAVKNLPECYKTNGNLKSWLVANWSWVWVLSEIFVTAAETPIIKIDYETKTKAKISRLSFKVGVWSYYRLTYGLRFIKITFNFDGILLLKLIRWESRQLKSSRPLPSCDVILISYHYFWSGI